MEQKFPVEIFELIITRVRGGKAVVLGIAAISDKRIMSDPLITASSLICNNQQRRDILIN